MGYLGTAIYITLFLVGCAVLVWFLVTHGAPKAPKAPKPEPDYVEQIPTLELAFPVGRPFTYMGLELYPFRYWRFFRDGPHSVDCVAELHCEYRDAQGVIRMHRLTYAQAMAIAANAPCRVDSSRVSEAAAAALAEHAAPLRDDHDHAEPYG